jgi:uracil-DNA glycosylase
MPAGSGRHMDPAAELHAVAERARGCQACELWRPATQTVFGRGRVSAPYLLVGEQPGDREDVEGAPFVGPAGRILDQALERAGIEPDQIYLTNAVKHFKFEPRGKRRIHQRPNRTEINACRPWLTAELDLVRPRVVVCLGATAAEAYTGRTVVISRTHGKVIERDGDRPFVVTVHPASVLRQRDEPARRQALEGMVADLEVARRYVESTP